MASLIHETTTRCGWRLQCYDPANSRRRHSVWLGDITEREAHTIRRHVEAVIESQKLGTPLSGETVRWLNKSSEALRTKLAPLLGAAKSVRQAVEAYELWASTALKPSTVRGNMQTLGEFRADFGGRQMRSLVADEIDQWLRTRNVSPNTTAKHAKNLKAFIGWARRLRLVDDLRLDSSSSITAGKKEFVGAERFERLLREFRDPEERCVLGLARWTGLRVPSELAIVRAGVDWEKLRLTVPDSKRTRRSSRGPPAERTMPIYPELSPFVEAVWDRSAAPTDYLLPSIVGSRAIVAHVSATCARIGLHWPRLFHSLRATRQTELIARFGVRAACDWIGNSPSVAGEFYELVADETWAVASGSVSPPRTHTTNENAG